MQYEIRKTASHGYFTYGTSATFLFTTSSHRQNGTPDRGCRFVVGKSQPKTNFYFLISLFKKLYNLTSLSLIVSLVVPNSLATSSNVYCRS